MPTFWRILGELLVFTIIEEIFFFYAHWALHSKYLYARFHKIHHEWTATVGLAASYMHPFEYFISDSIPNRVAPLLLASHPVTIWIWHFLANLYTINRYSINYILLKSRFKFFLFIVTRDTTYPSCHLMKITIFIINGSMSIMEA